MHSSTLQSVLEHLRKLTDPARVGELSDADLLERFRRCREEAAFTLLVQRHGPMVLAVCRRILGNAHDAEDAFQATFLVLVRNAAAIRKQQSLASWLHGVASRIAHKSRVRSAVSANGRRQPAGRSDQPADAGRSPIIHDDPVETLAAAELRTALDEEIERLPDKYRTPLVLCYLADKTHEQAAIELGWPKSSVTARLARARELLQRRLIRRGFTAPAGLLVALLTETTANAALPSLLTLSTVRLAVQALAGESLAATSVAVLAESFVKGKAVAKFTAVLTLLTTMGFATALGTWMASTRVPSEQFKAPLQPIDDRGEKQAQTRKPRVDLFGDPLPDGALARIGSGRMRHHGTYKPRPLAFTPDGKSIVSGGNGSLRIWDAATGKLQRRFNFDDANDWCTDFVFHADGILAASGRFNNTVTISVLDSSSGQIRRRMRMPDPFIMPRPIFSSDGKQIAYGHDRKTVRIYDAASGRETLRIPVGKMPWTFGAAFTPDGKTIALCDLSDTIRLHDTATGKCVRELKRDGGKIIVLSFSPDGRFLASLSNSQATRTTNPNRISVWDLTTGKERHRLKMPSEGIFCIAFSPDSKYVAAGGSHNELLLWDVATGKEVRRFPCGIGGVSKIAFSPDGKRIALCTGGGAIQLWDLATGRTLPGSADPLLDSVHALRFSFDGRRLLGRTDRYVAWDPATGREIRRTAKVSDLPWTLALSPDESLLAGTDLKGTIHLWDAATGRPRHSLNGDTHIYSCEFSPDGRWLVSQRDDKSMLWDVASGRLHQFFSSGKEMRLPVVSPDARWLAAAEYPSGIRRQEITLWHLTTGREKMRFVPAQATYLHQLVFSPDSRFLAAAGGASGDRAGEIAVWNIANGERWHARDEHKDPVLHVAFSPDGRMLATGGCGGTLFLWELASGRKRHQFIGHEDDISSLAFSPDGRLLATASPETPVFVWDVVGAFEAKRLTNDALHRCWNALASEDASAAFQAIRHLAAAPEQTLLYLRHHLRPVPVPDFKRVRQLVEMLDSAEFSTRQNATEELENQADAAAGLLRRIMAKEKPSLEVRRRLQQILESIESKPETLRAVRAVEVLEWIATPDAVHLLGELANGTADARLTREAGTAKQRLSR